MNTNLNKPPPEDGLFYLNGMFQICSVTMDYGDLKLMIDYSITKFNTKDSLNLNYLKLLTAPSEILIQDLVKEENYSKKKFKDLLNYIPDPSLNPEKNSISIDSMLNGLQPTEKILLLMIKNYYHLSKIL